MSECHVLLFQLHLSGSVDLKPGFTLETPGVIKQVLMAESNWISVSGEWGLAFLMYCEGHELSISTLSPTPFDYKFLEVETLVVVWWTLPLPRVSLSVSVNAQYSGLGTMTSQKAHWPEQPYSGLSISQANIQEMVWREVGALPTSARKETALLSSEAQSCCRPVEGAFTKKGQTCEEVPRCCQTQLARVLSQSKRSELGLKVQKAHG